VDLLSPTEITEVAFLGEITGYKTFGSLTVDAPNSDIRDRLSNSGARPARFAGLATGARGDYRWGVARHGQGRIVGYGHDDSFNDDRIPGRQAAWSRLA